MTPQFLRHLIGMRVDNTNHHEATAQIIAWARGQAEAAAGRSQLWALRIGDAREGCQP